MRGFDRRTSSFIDPASIDILGFCGNQWISDYTYDGLLARRVRERQLTMPPAAQS